MRQSGFLTPTEREALRVFVNHAPFFTPYDWAALPPEWRVAWDTARDLMRPRLRGGRGGRVLPSRLTGISLIGAMEIILGLARLDIGKELEDGSKEAE